jgi:site-specific recombinase XerD
MDDRDKRLIEYFKVLRGLNKKKCTPGKTDLSDLIRYAKENNISLGELTEEDIRKYAKRQ